MTYPGEKNIFGRDNPSRALAAEELRHLAQVVANGGYLAGDTSSQ